ncbi:MAG: hydrogenase maturation protease [Nitrospirae bacterium]|nr:hydrogenase maturation protease [Nitrospirota bacterium]
MHSSNEHDLKSTLVLGVGNLLRRDDGIGIHVIRELERAGLPESVRILDGGTAGLDLVTYLEGIDRLIIVDALIADGKPGDIRILTQEQTGEDYFLSGHLGRLGDMLDMTAVLGKRPETTIVGIIPADCEGYGETLSPELYPAVARAAGLIAQMLQADVPEYHRAD